MHSQDVAQLIRNAIPDADIHVEGEGCNFTVIVVSPSFAGLSLLKKQQAVLAPLSARIQTGELHAVTVKAYTPEEYGR